MTPPHINLYILAIVKNARNEMEIHPFSSERTRRRMNETHTSNEEHSKPGLYEIRIKGHLADRWVYWFEGLTITLEEGGDTLLTGPVVDQSALHGLLRKVRDLGMPLLSVCAIEPSGFDASDIK